LGDFGIKLFRASTLIRSGVFVSTTNLFLYILKAEITRSEMKSNDSFELIFLNSSDTRLEIKFSSPLGELISEDNKDGRGSLCSRPVLEKSL
jgi:hypothetical protein